MNKKWPEFYFLKTVWGAVLQIIHRSQSTQGLLFFLFPGYIKLKKKNFIHKVDFPLN